MWLASVDLSKVRVCRANSFWISLRKLFLSSLLNKRENAVVNTFLVVYSRSESHYCIVGYVECDVEAALDSWLRDLGILWQKLLDFGEVKRSYISFFDIEKHETVNSRWDLELGQEQMRFDIGKEKEVKLVKKCLG
uniref:Uncharacterized protein n=1 Tax=Brassica oleracea var. oleracea TaxID=109376 RepID=A0A0D3BWL7_BRAOL